MKNLTSRTAAGKFMSRMIAHQNSLGTRMDNHSSHKSSTHHSGPRKLTNADGENFFIEGLSEVDGDDVVQ